MRNRVAVVLSVLALMGGWGGGMGSRSAAGTPKAYVGLFKEDAVAPPLNREPDPSSASRWASRVPSGARR